MKKTAAEIHNHIVDLVETQKEELIDQRMYGRKPSDYEIGHCDALCNLLEWIEDDID